MGHFQSHNITSSGSQNKKKIIVPLSSKCPKYKNSYFIKAFISLQLAAVAFRQESQMRLLKFAQRALDLDPLVLDWTYRASDLKSQLPAASNVALNWQLEPPT